MGKTVAEQTELAWSYHVGALWRTILHAGWRHN